MATATATNSSSAFASNVSTVTTTITAGDHTPTTPQTTTPTTTASASDSTTILNSKSAPSNHTRKGSTYKLPLPSSRTGESKNYSDRRVDPLTIQILKRTGTENTIPQKLRQSEKEREREREKEKERERQQEKGRERERDEWRKSLDAERKLAGEGEADQYLREKKSDVNGISALPTKK